MNEKGENPYTDEPDNSQDKVDAASRLNLIYKINENEREIVDYLTVCGVDPAGLDELLDPRDADPVTAAQLVFQAIDLAIELEEAGLPPEAISRANRLAEFAYAVNRIANAAAGALEDPQQSVCNSISACQHLTEREREVLIEAADIFLGQEAFAVPDFDELIAEPPVPTLHEYEEASDKASALLDELFASKYNINLSDEAYSVLKVGVRLAAIMKSTDIISGDIGKALTELGIPEARDDFYAIAETIIGKINE